MASYLNPQEIRNSLRMLVTEYVEECKTCKEIPPDFIDLIKHNFLAKYVAYNPGTKNIEIGVEQAGNGPYPEIKVYEFSVGKASQWLDKSFKQSNCDLQYYGKLLNKHDILGDSDIVLY